MRTLTAIGYLAPAALLFSCDQQHPASDTDPKLGFECYEIHRAILPPGSQYEGIGKRAADRLTIKIMNGVDVVTLDCGLNPDGTLQDTVK